MAKSNLPTYLVVCGWLGFLAAWIIGLLVTLLINLGILAGVIAAVYWLCTGEFPFAS